MLSHALLPLSLWEKALGGLVGLQSSRGDKLTAAEGDWTQRHWPGIEMSWLFFFWGGGGKQAQAGA